MCRQGAPVPAGGVNAINTANGAPTAAKKKKKKGCCRRFCPCCCPGGLGGGGDGLGGDDSDEEARADAKALISQIKNVTGLWEDDPEEVSAFC